MVVLKKEDRCRVAEGPIWDSDRNKLLFVDILGKCFYSYDYYTEDIEKIDVGQQIGCMALCKNGDFLLAMEDGIYRMNHQRETKLAHQPIKIKGRRFNDGKIGPDGCFYLGTTDDNAQGAFYRLKDGVLKELFDGCGCANGLDWTVDYKKMFYCDSRLQKIEVFDFDIDSHTLSNRRTFAKIDNKYGVPDGLAMDSQDHIWLGLWDGGAILEVKKNGKFGEKIEVPARKASSCCFAGKDLTDLIITTASKNDEESYPLSGYVFKTEAKVTGKKPFKYIY